MPRPEAYREVKNRNRLTLQDRIRVIKAYKKTPYYRQLASQFKCSLNQIKAIITTKKKILAEYAKSKEHLAEAERAVNSQALLEKTVYEWFQRAQRHIETGPISNEMFMQRAEVAKHIFYLPNIQIDLDWLLKFRQKYDISDLDMTMLRIGDDNEPLSLDLNEIALYVTNRNPMLSGDLEVLSELSDLESDNPDETISQKLQLPDRYCDNRNDQSRKVTVDSKELALPPIANNEQAKLYLKPLEDYVLMKENFRAIGLIAQLEEIFDGRTQE